MCKNVGKHVLVMVLVFSLSGCSMGWDASQKNKISDEDLYPLVGQMIEEQKEVVWPYLQDEITRALEEEPIEGTTIVQNTLSEENGRSYLEFCYAVGDPQGKEDIEQVVAFAHSLLNEEQRQELDQKLEQTRDVLFEQGASLARGLAPSQRAAFWKDMQKLVTRTLVLFTAGVVYSCIPTTVFWGKISAATAIAVAAGVVSSTIMSIWRYYQFGGSMEESFNDWLKTVTTEPELSYALAASVISMGNTLKRGPVVTGIIICVFALYNVIDMVRP
ncbi:MAG: hypothetical protein EOM15_10940, partial [Spirochaetia bacterium]|nr:hypothetical protein [Spirochaetia bacterium]